MSRPSHLSVAVAVIIDQNNRILITQRGLHTSHAGFWEFPGGKLEENETPEKALHREIQEELGITVLLPTFLGEVKHSYPEKTVTLLVFLVKQYQGQAQRCEKQLDLRWVSFEALQTYNFPPANHEIINLIRAVYDDKLCVN